MRPRTEEFLEATGLSALNFTNGTLIMKIKLALITLALAVCSIAQAQDIPTRFGLLKIDAEKTLLYKGVPVKPQIQGNSGLSLFGVFQQGNTDVVLIQDDGGAGCPAVFYFVVTSAGGVKATKPFGTCSDVILLMQPPDGIVVSMPGFAGPFEPQAAQQRAAKQRLDFVFRDGVLMQNGKPIK